MSIVCPVSVVVPDFPVRFLQNFNTHTNVYTQAWT